ncbi:MAG: single-stranded DNA-binding protein [Candidatus Latescibacteria bacterium]|nr:single-stranded DNA-binding protein [Candidatus Latescibacterota bacterium]
MARGLNKAMLIGNLGADPEIKYSASGTAIANLRLATAEKRKNRDGEWEDITEWHRVVMFGKQAETCKDYLKKGSKIFVEGRIQTRSWDDQNGQKHYATEIIGNNFIFLESRGQESPVNSQRFQDSSSSFDSSQPPPHHDISQEEDDLPF